MAIDIGAAATDRGSSATLINTNAWKDNPANATGTITTIEIWLATNGSNVEVATFIDEGSDVLSTRDYETLGSVTAGSKQTFSGLDMDVATGDYIGSYGTAGTCEADSSGGAGQWYVSASDEIPCSSVQFTSYGEYVASLYGSDAAAGWTGKIMGVTNPAKICGVAVANISKVCGVS